MCDRIGIIREGRIIETGTLTEMRHLTRTMITVQTRQLLPDLSITPGVHGFKTFENAKNKASFTVDSDKLDQLMQTLAKLEIVSLQSTPPTLEDLFLRYYQKDEEGEHDDQK